MAAPDGWVKINETCIRNGKLTIQACRSSSGKRIFLIYDRNYCALDRNFITRIDNYDEALKIAMEKVIDAGRSAI